VEVIYFYKIAKKNIKENKKTQGSMGGLEKD
jgi:hypothetical protein